MDNPIAGLIEKWPAPQVATFARDLGVTVEHASAMKRRRSIPVKYWQRVLKSADSRGIEGISYETLANLHTQEVPFQ